MIQLIARAAICAIALVGVAYGAQFVADGEARLDSMARKVVRGERFRNAELAQTIDESRLPPGACDAERLRNQAILQAQITDNVISDGDLDEIDTETAALSKSADRLIACSPREPFGWLMRFWTRTRQAGLDGAAMEALASSYRYGPREAWVAIRRNPMAIGILGRLPPELQQVALAEFAGLLEQQAIDSPAATLAAASLEVQDRLYKVAAELSEPVRLKLSFALRARGLPTRPLNLPEGPWRPWRRD